MEFIKRIYSFLNVNNVDFIPQTLNKKINITRNLKTKFKFPFIMPLLYNIFKVTLWNKKRKVMKGREINKISNLINHFYIKFSIWNKKITKEKNIKIHSIPPLKQKARMFLNKIYRNDIQKLENLLNKDLSFWK